MTTPDHPVGTGGHTLEALATRAEAFLRTSSVRPSTNRQYRRLFDNYWVPLCEQNQVEPLAAPPQMVVKLYRAARTGSLRRPGKNNQRTGPLSPGMLDAILAAVRHTYILEQQAPPQALIDAAALTEMRRSYAAHHAEQEVQGNRKDPVVPMSLEHYRTLCTTPTQQTRTEARTALIGLLSLDAAATVEELAHLATADVTARPAGAAVRLGDRTVYLECRHGLSFGIVPVCTACLLLRYVDAPAALDSDVLLASTPAHIRRPQLLRVSIHGRLTVLADRWPSLSRVEDGNQQTRLGYLPGTSPRLQLGTRQGVALSSTCTGYALLLVRTAMKLAACGGLTAPDLFERLQCGDVAGAVVAGERDRASEVHLRLPETVRAHTATEVEVWVGAQTNPEMCGVTALVEWLLIREAAQGATPAGDDPVFANTRAWGHGGAGPTTVLQGTALLRTLQARAGIETVYRWPSIRELYHASLVAQGKDELAVQRALRLKKPEQARRAASRHAAPGTAPRRAAEQ